MPPTTEAEAIGWLLFFLPGFVLLAVAAYIGWPATSRSQTHWIAYSLLLSLALTLLVRVVLDPWTSGALDAQHHPAARAVALLMLGFGGGITLGWLQTAKWFNRLWWWLFREKAQPTVWTSFFRDPSHGMWARIQMADGRTLVGHVDQYSVDAGRAARELVMTDVRLEARGGWIPIPGAVLLDSGRVDSVVLVTSGGELSDVTDAFDRAREQRARSAHARLLAWLRM
jgi:hypothetical protein